MGLTECMQKHTYRQFKMWMEYLNQQMNEPGRLEYYIMALRNDVQNMGRKKGRAADFKKLKVSFATKGAETPSSVFTRKLTQEELDAGFAQPPRPLTKDAIAEMQKQRAMAIVKSGNKQNLKR